MVFDIYELIERSSLFQPSFPIRDIPINGNRWSNTNTAFCGIISLIKKIAVAQRKNMLDETIIKPQFPAVVSGLETEGAISKYRIGIESFSHSFRK